MARGERLTEERRRVEAELSRAKASYMSNSKWLSLFTTLRAAGVGAVRWKFVHSDRIFVEPVPPADALRPTGLADVLPAPYASFREIEWLEVTGSQSLYTQLRETEKAFPWCESEGGLRVVAYEW